MERHIRSAPISPAVASISGSPTSASRESDPSALDEMIARRAEHYRGALVELDAGHAAELEIGRGMEPAASAHVQEPASPFIACHLEVPPEHGAADDERHAAPAGGEDEHGGRQRTHQGDSTQDGYRYPELVHRIFSLMLQEQEQSGCQAVDLLSVCFS